MRLLITGGSLEAEIQNNPLAKIQKQLATISQKSELDISNIRAYIDKISELKDRRIDDLIAEFESRSKLESMELEQLESLVVTISKERSTPVNTLETSAIREQLLSNESKTKDIFNRINEKLDRITKDGAERAKRLQEEIVRTNSESKKKVSVLKDELNRLATAREKEQTQTAVTKAKEYLPEHKAMKKVGVLDGRKYMGKLNFKPKMPI